MDVQKAALAGLLHDVGKFWQRAESSPQQKVPPNYTQYSKADFGSNGTHAAWSAAFVEATVPESLRDVWSGVFYHHNPQDELARLVALADHLSAGEREADKGGHPQQLLSVFGELFGENMPPSYWPLNELVMDHTRQDELFPQTKPLTEAQAKKNYRGMWGGFYEAAMALMSVDDPNTYIESVQALMMRYTWSIPSAYWGSQPNISLYDHSRTTAALAGAMAASLDDATVTRLLGLSGKAKKADKTPVVSFIEGDISGIQKFIYNVTAAGAAKSLRGRSVYLRVLTEAIARMILRRLGLPATNILYVGGGHFYLIGSLDALEQMPDIQAELDRFMLAHHDGDLYIALGAMPLTTQQLYDPAQFSKVWPAVGSRTKRAKRQRYTALGAEDMAAMVFAPRPLEGELGKRRIERDADSEGARFSQSIIEMSTNLRRADAMLLAEVEPQARPAGGYNAALNALGYHLALVSGDTHDVLGYGHNVQPIRATLLGMTDMPDENMVERVVETVGCPLAVGIRHTANTVAMRDNGTVADFSHLQDASNGLKRLGVLRMDVDDLGQIFARGFYNEEGGNPRSTLSRVANLSFSMGLYFEGWVNQICRRYNEKQVRSVKGVGVQPVYVVYTGGDDLFIVGAWDALPKLAHDISDDLHAFAVENPRVHVSAGITLHGGKYPLYRAAEDAEEALDEAKSMNGKNAIHFFDMSVCWSDWNHVRQMAITMWRITDDTLKKPVPRSLYQTLLGLYESYDETRKEYYRQRELRGGTVDCDRQKEVVAGPWLWHSVYQLTRLAQRHPDYRTQIIGLQNHLAVDKFGGIEQVALAARWAEAYTRKNQKNTEEF